jgi:hypothetical protein
MQVHIAVHFETRFMCKQDVSYRLSVYEAYCENPLDQSVVTFGELSMGGDSVLWIMFCRDAT